MKTAILFVSLSLAAPAQDGGVHPPSPVERMLGSGGAGEEKDELEVLFGRVELRLREIDRMLYDASAGAPVQSTGESGLSDLLRQSRSRNQEVLDDIDRILEIAMERAQQSQSSPSQGGQEPGGEPQSQQNGPQQGSQEESTQREQTPQGPSGERPQQPDPQGEREDRGGQEPRNDQESPADGDTRRGDQPRRDATGPGAEGGADGRWGDLPVHVRELFRAQGGADLPPHYRDWIDSYYRRLNRDR